MEIRSLFYGSVESSKNADYFMSYLDKLGDKDLPLVSGYKGMGYMLLAKHGYNPYTRLNNFYKGRELLDKAIVGAPLNMELRFLRMTVQMNAPFFLNYSSKLQEDGDLIRKEYPASSDTDLRQRIKKFSDRRKLFLA